MPDLSTASPAGTASVASFGNAAATYLAKAVEDPHILQLLEAVTVRLLKCHVYNVVYRRFCLHVLENEEIGDMYLDDSSNSASGISWMYE